MTWKVNLYLENAGKAPLEKDEWYGYILTFQGKQFHEVEEYGHCSATRHRRELIMLIKALERCKPCELTIYTDSIYLKNNFSRIEHFVRNDWKKAGGEPIMHNDLWQQVEQLTKDKKVAFIYGAHKYTDRLKKGIKTKKNE